MKTWYWIAAGIILLAATAWYMSGEENTTHVTTEVSRGSFEVSVITTGELRARQSVEINAPRGMRAAGIYRVDISDLVPEGTVVEAGDYIATLDRAELSSKIQSKENELQALNSQFRQTQLDTMLELRGLRNELINLESNVEEREISVEQSQFEPPATQRQAKLNLDQARRSLKQARENYQIRTEQAKARMEEVQANLNQLRREIKQLEDLMDDFEIRAPEDGMVIYLRGGDGSRRGVGTTITPWNSVVATLPDLRVMISRTFVNEIDISKVETGQTVIVGIDAFPGRRISGVVESVANVGEELRRADARVFEVEVLLTEEDLTLRPNMTTSNRIITQQYDNVLHIPLEALHQNDNMYYVYKSAGRNAVKQQVKTGSANEDRIVIMEGLEEDDLVYLTIPSDVRGTEMLVSE
jgi:hypothetical protein